MIQSFGATFENGDFKPDDPPALSERTRVRPLVETEGDSEESRRQHAWANLERLWQSSTFDSHGDRLTRDQLHERR